MEIRRAVRGAASVDCWALEETENGTVEIGGERPRPLSPPARMFGSVCAVAVRLCSALPPRLSLICIASASQTFSFITPSLVSFLPLATRECAFL